jgi:arabinose-5-phosphate isomerase
MSYPTSNDHLATAKECLTSQAVALTNMAERVGPEFEKAVTAIIDCNGRVAVCGIGKSGAVGQKLAATLASTGTPAFFLHAAEAVHGDLGMLCVGDIVILLSYSGETEEVLRLISSLVSVGTPLICMTGNPSSTLAKRCDVVLDVSVEREVCPNNLAPTTSTLAMMALSDALAVALIKAKNFKIQDFAVFHPGGALGKRLQQPLSEVMQTTFPSISPSTSFDGCLEAIDKSGLGLALVIDSDACVGIITDGDLRRFLSKNNDLTQCVASDIMKTKPHRLPPHASILEAHNTMQAFKIKALLVSDSESTTPLGIVDIFRLGIQPPQPESFHQ